MDRDLAEYLEILGFSRTPFGAVATAAPVKKPSPGEAAASPLPSSLCVVVEESLDGAAQELLFRMLGAMGLRPESIFITPATDTLEADIAARHPRAALALGAGAGQVLLQGAAPAGQFTPHPRLRGEGGEPLPVMTTNSLRELLENPALKKSAWSHLQLVMPKLSGSSL